MKKILLLITLISTLKIDSLQPAISKDIVTRYYNYLKSFARTKPMQSTRPVSFQQKKIEPTKTPIATSSSPQSWWEWFQGKKSQGGTFNQSNYQRFKFEGNKTTGSSDEIKNAFQKSTKGALKGAGVFVFGLGALSGLESDDYREKRKALEEMENLIELSKQNLTLDQMNTLLDHLEKFLNKEEDKFLYIIAMNKLALLGYYMTEEKHMPLFERALNIFFKEVSKHKFNVIQTTPMHYLFIDHKKSDFKQNKAASLLLPYILNNNEAVSITATQGLLFVSDYFNKIFSKLSKEVQEKCIENLNTMNNVNGRFFDPLISIRGVSTIIDSGYAIPSKSEEAERLRSIAKQAYESAKLHKQDPSTSHYMDKYRDALIKGTTLFDKDAEMIELKPAW